jgi:hypothetical protein
VILELYLLNEENRSTLTLVAPQPPPSTRKSIKKAAGSENPPRYKFPLGVSRIPYSVEHENDDTIPVRYFKSLCAVEWRDMLMLTVEVEIDVDHIATENVVKAIIDVVDHACVLHTLCLDVSLLTQVIAALPVYAIESERFAPCLRDLTITRSRHDPEDLELNNALETVIDWLASRQSRGCSPVKEVAFKGLHDAMQTLESEVHRCGGDVVIEQ